MIRPPRPDELALLPQIENEADRRYVRVGLPAVLAMPPATTAALGQARRSGFLWVATSDLGRPVGFALMKVRSDAAWLDQLSVLDAWQGCGLGTALIERTEERARRLGFDRLFLSTYRDVPWNAPFYRRRGFAELPRAQWPRAIRQQIDRENAHGHPPWRRVVMVRLVRGHSAATARPICSQVGATSDTVARRMSRR